jgi:hypothetical protein
MTEISFCCGADIIDGFDMLCITRIYMKYPVYSSCQHSSWPYYLSPNSPAWGIVHRAKLFQITMSKLFFNQTLKR